MEIQRKNFALILTLALASTALLMGCGRDSGRGGSDETGERNSPGYGSTAPDNSARNARDRSGSTLTPGDQGGSDTDRETTRRIRDALTSNDQLSTDAKNIKIITTGGKVTLRGTVKSAQEKTAVESIVRQAGVGSMDDQLEVTTNNQ